MTRGIATDVTDGPLSGESLRWSSDRDGPLDTGNEIAPENLSPGWHTITLTATDSGGNSTSVSVRLFVGRRLYLPLVLR